jgi:hypothetical protein
MSKLDGTYIRELLPMDDPPRPAIDGGGHVHNSDHTAA